MFPSENWVNSEQICRRAVDSAIRRNGRNEDEGEKIDGGIANHHEGQKVKAKDAYCPPEIGRGGDDARCTVQIATSGGLCEYYKVGGRERVGAYIR